MLSLAIGSLTAIAQTSFKRVLAYSTISHMGFVLLGLMSGSVASKPELASAAYGASLFYMLTYVLTTLASFGIVLLLSRQGFECEQIDDLKGLNRRSPWHAAVVLLLMFSLAGIPPLVGFYAKLAVLQALVSAGHVTLAVIAVVFSLIGAFYYLRVVKVVYFDEPATVPPPMSATCGQRRAVGQRPADPGAGAVARRPDGPVRAGHPPARSACTSGHEPDPGGMAPDRAGPGRREPALPDGARVRRAAVEAGRGEDAIKPFWAPGRSLVFSQVVGALGFAFESVLGNRFSQTWEFYAITLSLYLVWLLSRFRVRYLFEGIRGCGRRAVAR